MHKIRALCLLIRTEPFKMLPLAGDVIGHSLSGIRKEFRVATFISI